MLRAFLLDFDGTIADTEPLHYRAFRDVLGRRGLALEEATYFERHLAGTDRECLERMLDDFRRPDLRGELDALLREKIAAFDELLAREARPFPGVRAFLDAAAGLGPVGIVTGSIAAPVRRFLDREGLSRRFAVLVAAGDVARGKPDPEGYRLGCERLRAAGADGLAPGECLAVEDAPAGIAAARAAGLRTLALAHSRPAADLAAADRVAAGYAAVDWNELRALFTGR